MIAIRFCLKYLKWITELVKNGHGSKFSNLSNRKEAVEEIRASTGFELVTFAIPVIILWWSFFCSLSSTTPVHFLNGVLLLVESLCCAYHHMFWLNKRKTERHIFSQLANLFSKKIELKELWHWRHIKPTWSQLEVSELKYIIEILFRRPLTKMFAKFKYSVLPTCVQLWGSKLSCTVNMWRLSSLSNTNLDMLET